MKKNKIILIAIVIVVLLGISEFNIYRTNLKSVDINAEFLQTNLTTPMDEKYDVAEVLHVEKFTKEESLAIALAKDSNGIPWIYVTWDGRSRYCHGIYFSIYDLTNFNDPYDYIELESTKFGQPYVCIFQNPDQDTIIVNGIEHDVFMFDCTIDGVDYNLGFYCGLIENK